MPPVLALNTAEVGVVRRISNLPAGAVLKVAAPLKPLAVTVNSSLIFFVVEDGLKVRLPEQGGPEASTIKSTVVDRAMPPQHSAKKVIG